MIDMRSPGDKSFKSAMHRTAKLLREEHIESYALVATIPDRVRKERDDGQTAGFAVESDAELATLDIQPWAVYEHRRDKKPRLLFKVAAGTDDVSAITSFAEVVSLYPKLLRALLSIVRPWHLAMLGVEGFEDVDRPDPETLAAAFGTVHAQLRRWGIGVELVGDEPAKEGSHES